MLRTSLAVTLLIGGFALSFSHLRFESRTLPHRAAPVTRAALSPQVAMVVLDGVREDRFRTLMSRTVARAKQFGVVCAVEAPALSFTAAGIYTLGTGDEPSLSLIPQNFQATPVAVDSVPAAVKRNGGRTLLFGEHVWADFFGGDANVVDGQRDLGPYAKGDSALVASRFFRAVAEKQCELCVWHDPNLDGVGHRFGVNDPRYEAEVRRTDELISGLFDDVARAGTKVTWLVTSDHGMTDAGNHGGPQPEARSSFLAAFGPGIRQGDCPSRLQQADIPTLSSVLLGTPIPWHSRGTIPTGMLTISAAEGRALDGEVLAQKERLATALAAAYRHSPPRAGATIREQLTTIQELQQSTSPWTLVIWMAPLAGAITVLLQRLRGSGTWWGRKALLGIVALAAVLGWGFSNAIYPRVSFPVASLTYGFTALMPIILVHWMSKNWPARLRRDVRLVAFLMAVITAEVHWVGWVQPVVLGAAVFFSWGAVTRGRWTASVGSAAVAATLVGLSIAGVLTVRGAAGAHGLAALAWLVGASAATGAVAASLMPRSTEVRWMRFVAGAAAYACVQQAPLHLWPWLPPGLGLVAALLVPRVLGWRVGAAAALMTLFALQMRPPHWMLFLLVAVFAARLLERAQLDERLGRYGAPWLRGLVLIGVTYIVDIAEGNRLNFADVNVLSGFLGGSLELYLPVTVSLVALYYAAPLIGVLVVWSFTTEAVGRIHRTVLAAAILAAAKISFYAVNFAWGTLAQGSWARQLMEILLLLVLLAVLLTMAAVTAAGGGAVARLALRHRRTHAVNDSPVATFTDESSSLRNPLAGGNTPDGRIAAASHAVPT